MVGVNAFATASQYIDKMIVVKYVFISSTLYLKERSQIYSWIS